MNFEEVKLVLGSWLQSQLGQTKEITVGNKEQVNINGSLLQLENWLINWKNEHQLNQSVNAAIFSDHILKQVHTTSASSAFQPIYYQLNFLHFLGLRYEPGIMLHDCIDQFLDVYKDQLSLSDIVITDTGATRAKTNIRFALNTLRKIGLVESKDLNGKRSFRPSIPGIVVLLNAHYQRSQLENSVGLYKVPENLRPINNNAIMSSSEFDPTLYASIRMFKRDSHPYSFLDQLWQGSVSETDRMILLIVMDQFVNFTQDAIEITEQGLRFTDEFSKKSKAFMETLYKQSKENEKLSTMLMKHYRGLYSK